MNKNVSIIGCGWLGFPLAKELIKKGFQVKGTTTSKRKLMLLGHEGIDAYFLNITPVGITGSVAECLTKSEVLILNIPPGLRKNPDLDYVGQIQHLIPYVETSGIKRLVFVSSTSVYADENSIPEITENTKPNPNTEAGKQLLKTEELLQNNPNFKTTVLRFAGLFGEDRHPAKQLSGRSKLKNGEAPINLIHLQDCMQIIVKIIENDLFGETLNASTEPHPTKQAYYTSVCNSMNLPLPIYDLSLKNKGKIIVSDKLKRVLNFKFQIKLQ